MNIFQKHIFRAIRDLLILYLQCFETVGLGVKEKIPPEKYHNDSLQRSFWDTLGPLANQSTCKAGSER